MKYALLIYEDESINDGKDVDITPWIEYTKAAAEAGILVAGAGLMPTSMATTVRKRDGKALTTDGPFAETKEQFGGFYVLDCKDLDDAIDWASRIPSVGTGSVEVRPAIPDEG
jgi:hypothetical protein